MPKQNNHKSRAETLLERSNKPILALAILAILLYILELFRIVPSAWITPFLWINFLIDFIFLIDLIAKCIILGRSYLRSPWFFIDFISTLPIISSTIELLGNVGPQLQATRAARGARIARVARVARLAKVARVARLVTAIRARQGLTFLKASTGPQETPKFNRSLFMGVPFLLVAFIIASSIITKLEVKELRQHIQEELSTITTQDALNALRTKYALNTALNSTELGTFPSPLVEGEEIVLSLNEAYTLADRLAGILLILVLLTIGTSVFISNALYKDRSLDRERSILSQCFSPPIVSKFYNSPEVIERFYNQWMTVFFIDIRGFTQAAEKDPDDVEGLALKLRKVMDTARDEIVVTHEGVIDKFMGDAVMGWVGGHFSSHWELLVDIRSKLHLDELDLVKQDIKSIEREIDNFEDDNNRTKKDLSLEQLQHIRRDLASKQSQLLELQKKAIAKNHDLESKLQALSLEYRRRVARSAVSCCLKIWKAVENIEDPEGFHELKIGVGSGPVLVGNFGSTEQIGFTVLGPTVNRSARLEPASAQVGCQILIDENTYELLKDYEAFSFRRVPRISLKGIHHEIVSYEPFFKEQVSAEFLAAFELGVASIESGQYPIAITHFQQANQLRRGGDIAAKLWIAECQKAIDGGYNLGVKAMKK